MSEPRNIHHELTKTVMPLAKMQGQLLLLSLRPSDVQAQCQEAVKLADELMRHLQTILGQRKDFPK